jgi:hypothetical protein
MFFFNKCRFHYRYQLHGEDFHRKPWRTGGVHGSVDVLPGPGRLAAQLDAV